MFIYIFRRFSKEKPPENIGSGYFEMNQNTSKVFGYVRVSTENQLENYSIEEQTVRIRSYCQAKGWHLLKIYTDGGYSGGNTNRPALQQMLFDIKQGKADAVVVYKLDRLSRSQKDTLNLIEDYMLAAGVDFISINENFDTSSPFGRAMIGILSVLRSWRRIRSLNVSPWGASGAVKRAIITAALPLRGVTGISEAS